MTAQSGGALVGGILGSVVAPGVGTVIGSTLGGAAGAGIGSLTAGNSAPTTSTTPASGTAQVYTPQNQPGADTAYTDLISNLIAMYQSGTLPSQIGYGGLTSQVGNLTNLSNQGYDLTQNILNNPYYTQQLAGATGAADYVAGQLPGLKDLYGTAAATALPGMLTEAGTLNDIGTTQRGYADTIAGYAPTLTGLSSTVSDLIKPTTTLGTDVATTVPQFQTLADKVTPLVDKASTATTDIASNIPAVRGYVDKIGSYMDPTIEGTSDLLSGAKTLLETGYDPRSTKYNQLTQQTRDEAQALSAMSGLLGTPYATGLANDAIRKMNIDWQDEQLQRQKDALAGAGTALETRGGLYGTAGKLGTAAIGGLQTAADIGEQTLGGLETGGKLLTETGNLLTAGGTQAKTAADIYGTAGTLGKTAGDLTLGAGTLTTEASQAEDRARLAADDAATIYAKLPTTVSDTTKALGGISTLQADAAGLPATTYTKQQTTGTTALTDQQKRVDDVIKAINSQVDTGNLTLQQGYNLLTKLGDYIKLGTSAAQTAVDAGRLSTEQTTAGLSGLTTVIDLATKTTSSGGLLDSLFSSGGQDVTGNVDTGSTLTEGGIAG